MSSIKNGAFGKKISRISQAVLEPRPILCPNGAAYVSPGSGSASLPQAWVTEHQGSQKVIVTLAVGGNCESEIETRGGNNRGV